MEYKFVAPCHFGLESILSGELKRMDAKNVKADNGKVYFEGDETILAKANLHLRTAERVLIILGSFTALTFDELFEGVYSIPFYDFIGENDAFPIKGYSLHSQLKSVPDCQGIIKKAIVKKMASHYNKEWFYESGSIYQIQFSIFKDEATIMLDTSGVGLHKRGYRKNSTEAPIKETLAAGIIDLARVKSYSTVYDPMCGSGTFVIESTLKALGIPPGINRKFAFSDFNFIDTQVLDNLRQDAIEKINRDCEYKCIGSDISLDAVSLSKINSKNAGVFSKVFISQDDIANFKPNTQKGIVFVNPPYGQRLLDVKQAEKLYVIMGNVLKQKEGFSYYIISPSEDFEKFFGKRATKKRKLYNGMIKCNLYMYF